MVLGEWDTQLGSKIDELKSSWQLDTLPLRRVLSGKSGASIFLVESKGAYDGLAILKIFPHSQSEEISRQIAAIEEGGSFTDSVCRRSASFC